MNFYSIRHLTRFEYEKPVSESLMEVRMHPKNEANQRCYNFSLSVSPRCRVFSYRDHLGNNVHHFDIPGQHKELVIIGRTLVELQPLDEVPASLPASSWGELDEIVRGGDYWEMLLPSEFAKPTEHLLQLASKLEVTRRDDPLSLLRELNTRIHQHFLYVPRSTQVDSPIDDAIVRGEGVCQDFSHIMIALVRQLGIPCRYVSGYLHHRPNSQNRSPESATHAWIDAFLPHLGWVGFDPTNDLITDTAHIRTALGRDYADVPPTRGIYRGLTASLLEVAVHVEEHHQAPSADEDILVPEDWSVHVERAMEPPPPASPVLQLQQLEQQQQSRRR